LIFQVITFQVVAPQTFTLIQCLPHYSTCPALQNLRHSTILIILCKLRTFLVHNILNHSTSSTVWPNTCFCTHEIMFISWTKKQIFEVTCNSTMFCGSTFLQIFKVNRMQFLNLASTSQCCSF
jgi:hypothetical protein